MSSFHYSFEAAPTDVHRVIELQSERKTKQRELEALTKRLEQLKMKRDHALRVEDNARMKAMQLQDARRFAEEKLRLENEVRTALEREKAERERFAQLQRASMSQSRQAALQRHNEETLTGVSALRSVHEAELRHAKEQLDLRAHENKVRVEQMKQDRLSGRDMKAQTIYQLKTVTADQLRKESMEATQRLVGIREQERSEREKLASSLRSSLQGSLSVAKQSSSERRCQDAAFMRQQSTSNASVKMQLLEQATQRNSQLHDAVLQAHTGAQGTRDSITRQRFEAANDLRQQNMNLALQVQQEAEEELKRNTLRAGAVREQRLHGTARVVQELAAAKQQSAAEWRDAKRQSLREEQVQREVQRSGVAGQARALRDGLRDKPRLAQEAVYEQRRMNAESLRRDNIRGLMEMSSKLEGDLAQRVATAQSRSRSVSPPRTRVFDHGCAQRIAEEEASIASLSRTLQKLHSERAQLESDLSRAQSRVVQASPAGIRPFSPHM